MTFSRRCLYHVLLAALSVCVALSLAEGILRMAGLYARRAPGQFFTYDEELGWRNKPNCSGVFRTQFSSVHVSINAQGLRDDDYPLTRRKDKNRLLVLGDSLAWGYGVEQQDVCFKIIERRHPEWEIINAAVSGYGTDQELLYLRRYGMRYGPDVVLLLFCPNDYDNNMDLATDSYPKPRFRLVDGVPHIENVPVPAAGIRQRLVRCLNAYSSIYRFGVVPLRVRLLKWAQGSGRDLRDPVGESYRLTLALLLDADEFVRSQNRKFIVVLAPCKPGDRRELARALREHGVSCLELDRAFSSFRPEELTFAGDLHWNRLGHKVVSEAIETYLFEQGLFLQPGTISDKGRRL